MSPIFLEVLPRAAQVRQESSTGFRLISKFDVFS